MPPAISTQAMIRYAQSPRVTAAQSITSEAVNCMDSPACWPGRRGLWRFLMLCGNMCRWRKQWDSYELM